METKTILLTVAAVIIVLFVPLYPLKLIKKILLFTINRFVPLPVKFEDIGGIPIISMRMYKVQMQLGATGTLEAEEMHLRIRFWRLITLRRPSINPLTLYKPRIRIRQISEKGEIWFLFPLTAMKWFVGTLFMNMWGLNIVRIYRGTIIIEGKRGETVIEDVNGEFTSHGSKTKVRRLSCNVGDGSLDIHFPRSAQPKEGKLVVRNMRLEDLVALKVPKTLYGPVNIEAVISGPVTDMELIGTISSPCLFMRNEPISDFHSPLRFKGMELILERMQGRIGEYQLQGTLTTNVETDISDLRLRGAGRGKASQSILKMLSMKPFIESAELEADVILQGDLNEFYEFTGDIKLKLKDAKVDFSQIGEGTMKGFPLAPIPEAMLHMKIVRGVLKFIDCRARSGSLLLKCDGKIDMHYDPEPDRVVRSQFEMQFGVDCPDLQELARMLSQDEFKFTGSAKADFRLDCDYSTFFHRLDGLGHISAENVHLTGFPLAKKRSVKSPVDLWFEKLDGEIVLEKEGIKCRNVICAGKWMDLRLDGGIGFFDKEIAIHGKVGMVPQSLQDNRFFKLLPGAGELAKHIKTGFKITGKTDHPNFSITLSDKLSEIIMRGFKRSEGSDPV